jgi:hypothetical protein
MTLKQRAATRYRNNHEWGLFSSTGRARSPGTVRDCCVRFCNTVCTHALMLLKNLSVFIHFGTAQDIFQLMVCKVFQMNSGRSSELVLFYEMAKAL